ncbi:LytR family transcriptional regulator [Geodermatophilaceae bacterium NBWT11]|nr:LytR family transcriptional regulator [Geodermatophilaceae bacterium NBWT11]
MSAADRPPTRTRGVTRAGRGLAAVVSLAVLVGSGYGWNAYRTLDASVTRVAAVPAGQGAGADGAAENVLLVGDDHRPADASPQLLAQLGTQQDGGSTNTDTMILLHLPADGGAPTAVSLPRDSWVDVPGHGTAKLNSAFADGAVSGGDAGGLQTLVGAVQELTGLTVDHVVRVSLLGFYEVARVLGPVRVCLDAAVDDPYSGLMLPAGVSTLDASQALAFVRQRHGLPHGDLDREVRQQYFLSAEAAAITSSGLLLHPGRLHDLLTAVGSAVETDPGLDLLQFAQRLSHTDPGAIRFTHLPITGTPTIRVAGHDVSIVAVDTLALPAFIDSVVGDPAAYTAATPAAPGTVTVQVLNGTGTPGRAGAAATALDAQGFTTGTGDASATTGLTTVTYPAGSEAAARAVAAAVPGVGIAESAGVSGVTLTLGTDGLSPATAESAPAAAAPATPAPVGAQTYDATSCID